MLAFEGIKTINLEIMHRDSRNTLHSFERRQVFDVVHTLMTQVKYLLINYLFISYNKSNSFNYFLYLTSHFPKMTFYTTVYFMKTGFCFPKIKKCYWAGFFKQNPPFKNDQQLLNHVNDLEKVGICISNLGVCWTTAESINKRNIYIEVCLSIHIEWLSKKTHKYLCS